MADTAGHAQAVEVDSPTCARPDLLTLIRLATKLSVIQTVLRLADWIKAIAVRKHQPDLVKTYQCRPKLPIR